MRDLQEQYDGEMAARWDQFINWPARAEAEGSFFVDRLREVGAKHVLDAACGTGFHTVSLAKAGFEVVASDASAAMVEQTRRACKAHDVDIEVLQADWRTLRERVPGKFDAVVVLGNSFTHLFSRSDRQRAIQQFGEMLNPSGMLIVDHRNYDRVLDQGYAFGHKVYYCGRDVGGGPVILREDFIRFRYGFADGSSRELDVYPIRHRELDELLAKAGFRQVTEFGDFETPFDRMETDFVIHCARIGPPHADGRQGASR